MAENPDFFSGDSEWLDEVMGGFGNEPEREPSLDGMTKDEIVKLKLIGFYFGQAYPNLEMKMPENLDMEALRMLRTLAHFVGNASIQNEDGSIYAISDRHPDLSVRHASMASRLGRSVNKKQVEETMPGGEANRVFTTMHSYFSVLTEISERAVEFEDRRMLRDREKS